MGGPYAAEVMVEGPSDEIWLCAEMLGRELRVGGEDGQVRWWGMINEVRINTDGMTYGFSLDDIANRVAVAYTTTKADGSSERKTTAWSINQDSINRFGTKERLYSIGDASDSQALARRDELLKNFAFPRGVASGGEGRGNFALLMGVGWWETLAWKTFTRLEGRIEFEGGVNTPGIQQAIGWQVTSTVISFSVKTITCTTAGVFANLKAGSIITVSGSTSNNTTLTLEKDGYDDGKKIDVTTTLVTESAGASVTVVLHGQRTAQKFVQAHAFTLWRVGMQVCKIGSPADSLHVKVQTDTAGSPSGTNVATCSIAASELGTSPEWIWLDATTNPSLTASSNYWLVVERSSSLDPFNHYLVQLDTTSHQTCKAWNGSSWAAQPQSQYVPFRVWGFEDTLTQLQNIVTNSGQFLTGGNDYTLTSGVKTNQWRDGDLSALDEAEKLVETGSASGGRYLVDVSPERVVRVTGEPVADVSNDVLLPGNVVRYAPGGLRPPEDLPVGEWLIIDKVPSHLNGLYAISPIFIDGAEYDFGQDKLRLSPKQITVE